MDIRDLNSGGFSSGGSSAGGMAGAGGVGGSGGPASGGAPANTGGAGGATVPIVPDPDGYVAPGTNSVGLQGSWYAFGDHLGETGMPPGMCQLAGHAEMECSLVTSPPPGRFPNVGGRMCTSGTAARVVDSVGKPGMPDYLHIDGAGIGLDWNNVGGAAAKGVFNATLKGVKGISFDLDLKPLAGMRVEFPTMDTAGGEAGPAYWGATPAYPPSPVQAGTNTIFWQDVTGPKGIHFNPSTMYGVRFHIPAATAAASAFSFCISNFKLLL